MPELKMADVPAVSAAKTSGATAAVLAEGNYADLSRDERVKEAYLGAGHA